MGQPYRAWLRHRPWGPVSILIRSLRRGRLALSLAAALSLLGAVVTVLSPAASAASGTYAVTEVPVGSAWDVTTDPATNTIYAGTTSGVDVIDGATNTFTSVPTGFVVGAVAVDHSSGSPSGTVYAFSAPLGPPTADVINGATITDTISMPFGATDAAADPAKNTVYVLDEGQATVAVINGTTNAVATFQLTGTSPSGLAVDTANNMVYVADTRNDQVVIINATTNAVTGRIALPAGSKPAGVAADSAAGLVYVADQGTGAISVINTASNTVSTLATGMTQPEGLAFDSQTGTLYATSPSGSADGLGTTYAIDAASGVIAGQIQRGGQSVAVAPGSGGSGGSAYVAFSPGALSSDVTVMTPGTTNTMSPVIVNTLATYSTFTVGQAVQDQLTANAIPAATFAAAGLPAGLTLSPSGLLSGTPAPGTGGEYAPVVTASNGIAPAATSDVGQVTVDEAPAITSADQVTFDAGVVSSLAVTASGFPASAFSETGALPAGITLSSGGVLSGTPAAGTAGAYPIQITASNGVGTAATQTFTLTVDGGSVFVPAGPVRVLDTRTGTGGHTGALGAGQFIRLQVTGTDGIPATGVTAVVLNVMAIHPTAASYLTVWPTGQPRPTASQLDFPAGTGLTTDNLITVPVGTGGKIDFYNYAGSVNIAADLAGYYTTAATGSTFFPAGPVRLLDTRAGIGALGAGRIISPQVAGIDGVPATGVTAVVLNVMAIHPTAASYLTVWPTGKPLPTASQLDFPAGAGLTVDNLITVPVGTGGCIDISNYAGSVNIAADLAGFFIGQ